MRLVDHDPEAEAERRVAAALVFAQTDWLLAGLQGSELDVGAEAGGGAGPPREPAGPGTASARARELTSEIAANFGAYRDLQRHRMLTQERQWLGFDVPEQLAVALGEPLAQYAVPLAYRLRWCVRLNLREVFHLCELRTTPQGHPNCRRAAQEVFGEVRRGPPAAGDARFVGLGAGDEMERRASEQKIDQKLRALRE